MRFRLPPWIAVCAAFIPTLPEAASGPRERVLESVPGRLRLEITAPEMRVLPVPGQAGIRIACDGCGAPAAGAPDLPIHRFDVRTGESRPRVRLAVLETAALEVPGVAPVPEIRLDHSLAYRPDPALAASAGRIEARFFEPAAIRGVLNRGVAVPLAVLDPGGRSVTLIRRMEVEVTWDPALPPRPAARKRGAGRAPADLGERFIRIRVGDRSLESLEEDRFWSVAFAQLASVSKAIQGGIRIRDLRLYTGARDSLPRSMGALPEEAGDMPGALREIPLEVLDDGDSTFDAGDALRFYAHGTSHWKRVPGTTPIRYAFAADPWSFVNTYWLAWSGKAAGEALRLEEGASGAPPGARTVGRDYFRAEREVGTGGCELAGHRDSAAGFVWFWHRRGSCGEKPDTVLRAGQLAGGPGATLADWAPGGADPADPADDSVHVSLHTWPPEQDDLFRVHPAGSRAALAYAPGEPIEGARYAWAGPAAPPPPGEPFRLDSLGWRGWARSLEGYSVSYPRRLEWRGKPLRILPEAEGPQAWRISGAGGHLALRLVDGVATGRFVLDASGAFSDSPPSGACVQYLVAQAASPLPDSALAEEALPASGGPLADLTFSGRDPGQVPEYLIITSDALLDAALALRDWRRAPARARPFRAEVVRMADIQRNFSSGRTSPAGIRDFLRWAVHRWARGGVPASPLSHVVLFGGGHFDYRGIESAGRTDAPTQHVPAYQSYHDPYAVATDDFYVRLDSGETDIRDGGLDLAIGRVPVRTAAEAAGYLEKVKAWEDPAQAGEWRSRAILASDDHMQRGGRLNLDSGIPEGHTNPSEEIGKTMARHHPALFLERVHLVEYPMNSSWRKPQAAQDLINFINRGAIAVNYLGHGSANQWADEVLLQTADALSALENKGRTPMINSFSCAVGRFDAFVPGMSETLVSRSGVGAIAALSATRESWPGPNEALADAFYARALPPESGPGAVTLGEALRDAKNLRSTARNGVNDAKYHILGDPALMLRKPRLSVALASRPDTLRPLDCGRFDGTVAGGSGSGFVNLKVLGGSERKEYDLPEDMKTQVVNRRGSVLFEQTVPYRDGRFSVEYLIPARLPFGDTAARLTVFAWDGARESEGSVAVERIHLRGRTGEGPCSDGGDAKGPAIRITGCEAKESGGLDLPERVRLALPGCLQIRVEDSAGGVLSADGPDEGTTLEVPGVIDPFHPRAGLDELYVKTYRLPLEKRAFRPGPHLLKVTAQDGYGNRSQKQMRMDLTLDSSIQTVTAYNIPNPVKRSGTAFYFSTLLPNPDVVVEEGGGGGGGTGRVSFEVRIFDQTGRVVKILREARSGQRWDGRDEWGNRLANGVYFYAVTARWNQPEGGAAPSYRVLSTKRSTLVLSR